MTRPEARRWDPRSEAVLADQTAAYDDLRRRCPVAHSELLGWSVFRHEDVAHVLEDHETFSNDVSQHRSVPNGLDPPAHTAYRQAIEPYLSQERVEAFDPTCREIARSLLERLPETLDWMEGFATPFAARCQCAFLGWPAGSAEPIAAWTHAHQQATLAGDRPALTALADDFRTRVGALTAARRPDSAASDVTSSLLRQRVAGVPLSDEELTSLLRNWTVGEVGSLAAALGTLAHHLATHDALQRRLRADPALWPAAIEEILRMASPLVANRRRATRDVAIAGQHIAAGDVVTLMWVAANRDEQVFDRPDEVDLSRGQGANLLWGAGIHACPGAPLARMELRVAMEALQAHARQIELSPHASARRAVYPVNGWATLPLRLVGW